MRCGWDGRAGTRCHEHPVMNMLLVLIPAALLLGLVGLGAFLWALKSGQFEDLDGASERVLIDEEDAHRDG